MEQVISVSLVFLSTDADRSAIVDMGIWYRCDAIGGTDFFQSIEWSDYVSIYFTCRVNQLLINLPSFPSSTDMLPTRLMYQT